MISRVIGDRVRRMQDDVEVVIVEEVKARQKGNLTIDGGGEGHDVCICSKGKVGRCIHQNVSCLGESVA